MIHSNPAKSIESVKRLPLTAIDAIRESVRFEEIRAATATDRGTKRDWRAEFDSPICVRVQADPEHLYHAFYEGEATGEHGSYKYHARLTDTNHHASCVDLEFEITEAGA